MAAKNIPHKRLSKRAFPAINFRLIWPRHCEVCFVMLFVMRKGIHECNTKRNNIYMPSNLFSFLHVTTATNTFCVKRECNHGFAPLNCDFENNKAAVGVFYNVVQF